LRREDDTTEGAGTAVAFRIRLQVVGLAMDDECTPVGVRQVGERESIADQAELSAATVIDGDVAKITRMSVTWRRAPVLGAVWVEVPAGGEELGAGRVADAGLVDMNSVVARLQFIHGARDGDTT
jgi:hypothetical protein